MRMSEYIALPTAVVNDANAAAIAESELGAGADSESFIYVTLGTGIGGSIIVNKEIFAGNNGGAGEIGHLIIDAFDKEESHDFPFRTGILEEKIGRMQILRLADSIIESHPESILKQKTAFDVSDISEAAETGDNAAIICLEKVGYFLGLGIASAMNLLDINIAVIGGGISQAHPALVLSASDTIRRRALPTIAGNAEIRKAKFGNDAGIAGAALVGKRLLQ